jgi:hypothetical protein
MLIAATGFWTTNHVLVITNVVLATATIITAVAAVRAIKASNRVAEATEADVRASLEQLKINEALVRVGGEQAELTKAGLDASIRPLIVDVPYGALAEVNETIFPGQPGQVVGRHDAGTIFFREHLDRSWIGVSLPVRNVGVGPAFIRSVKASFGSAAIEARRLRHLVPPGEFMRVEVVTTPEDVMHATLGMLLDGADFGLDIWVDFTDLAGHQHTRSQFTLVGKAEALGVFRVQLFNCSPSWDRETEAFVGSGT